MLKLYFCLITKVKLFVHYFQALLTHVANEKYVFIFISQQ